MDLFCCVFSSLPSSATVCYFLQPFRSLRSHRSRSWRAWLPPPSSSLNCAFALSTCAASSAPSPAPSSASSEHRSSAWSCAGPARRTDLRRHSGLCPAADDLRRPARRHQQGRTAQPRRARHRLHRRKSHPQELQSPRHLGHHRRPHRRRRRHRLHGRRLRHPRVRPARAADRRRLHRQLQAPARPPRPGHAAAHAVQPNLQIQIVPDDFPSIKEVDLKLSNWPRNGTPKSSPTTSTSTKSPSSIASKSSTSTTSPTPSSPSSCPAKR
jgi:hypothetical protein